MSAAAPVNRRNLVVADWFAAFEAEIALNAGQVDTALTLARAAIDHARAVGSVFGEGFARRVCAQALLAGGITDTLRSVEVLEVHDLTATRWTRHERVLLDERTRRSRFLSIDRPPQPEDAASLPRSAGGHVLGRRPAAPAHLRRPPQLTARSVRRWRCA